DYATGLRIFKAGIIVMMMTGFLAFITLFFSAEFLASKMITNEDANNVEQITVADVTMVIRMVSFALLIIPAMRIVRGFFHGYQSMSLTAVSLVVEQSGCIIFFLIASFIFITVFNGPIATAVGFASFAAFVGGIASCVVLWIYWRRRRNQIRLNIKEQPFTNPIPR